MSDKLKKFFKIKKLDTTFKRAGPGYKLNDTPSSSLSSQSDEYEPGPARSGLTEETKLAGEAALARLEAKKNVTSYGRSLSAVQAQVRRELAAEKEKLIKREPNPVKKCEIEVEAPSIFAATGVFFKCPLIGPQVLKREEWYEKIREFLYEQFSEEKGLTACLILHSLNNCQEKVKQCVDTLIKYFENILRNPTEEKYRKIRLSNRIFQEKIIPMEGALLVLEAAGFEMKKLPHDDTEEDFLVFPEEKLEEAHDTFEVLIDALRNAEPITLELDRNLQVLLPVEARNRSELPAAFFNLTLEEIRREQELRTEAVEKSQMLRTKAMRERDEAREVRKYKFGVIRIRFPENVFLQGTFGVYEKFSAVIDFVRNVLNDESIPFSLTTATGQTLKNENLTLYELQLVPTVVINFKAEVQMKNYLKPEVMALMQTLSSENDNNIPLKL